MIIRKGTTGTSTFFSLGFCLPEASGHDANIRPSVWMLVPIEGTRARALFPIKSRPFEDPAPSEKRNRSSQGPDPGRSGIRLGAGSRGKVWTQGCPSSTLFSTSSRPAFGPLWDRANLGGVKGCRLREGWGETWGGAAGKG